LKAGERRSVFRDDRTAPAVIEADRRHIDVLANVVGTRDRGNIPMIIGTPPTILPHVEAGSLVALCATSAERSSVMPNVPGANEVGLKGMDSVAWFGLFAPAKTPSDIVAKLHAAIQTVVSDKSLYQTLGKEGLEPRGSESPEAFARFQKKEYDENVAIIREAGLAPP
jgi:tripartite-type tricarboxylate transporter receptor subunit TctC